MSSCETSSFTILHASGSHSAKRRRWHEGWLYVSFDKATVVDRSSRKVLSTVSGTGLLPNNVFTMMVEADNGAKWVAGFELTVGRCVVQIEEVMCLHLLPYPAMGRGIVIPSVGGDAQKDIITEVDVVDIGSEKEPVLRSLQCDVDKVVANGTRSCPSLGQKSARQLMLELRDACPHLSL
uniref:Uncharacterized protein n=1 Tax=Trypanosoma congolense (strain IL3000) TaxID=1068625 RepID=G0UQQ6_TRYCI|nr:conserved hypothetical protein [Trypanosoma congolense IL3000]